MDSDKKSRVKQFQFPGRPVVPRSQPLRLRTQGNKFREFTLFNRDQLLVGKKYAALRNASFGIYDEDSDMDILSSNSYVENTKTFMLAHLLKAVQTYDLEKDGSRGRKTYDLEKAGSRGMLQQPSDTSRAVDQTSHDAQVEDFICHESLSGVIEGACSETSPLREKLYIGGGEDDLVEWDEVPSYQASAHDEMDWKPNLKKFIIWKIIIYKNEHH